MGEYGLFVWGSFGIVAAVMLLLALQSWIGRQQDLKQLRRLEELNTPETEEVTE
ncbi:heme exporter protein CcmD [Emcibacter sp.]|uniref:heme exporter protein CcmD n=1 Tax=Emcibacter sp. TaxID=1979954 RepID=UPI002AA82801|nr:heme exporter protein CcmD [Emcibacter sp.]